MGINDEELVVAYACRQDAEAFAALVDRYQSFIYATCLRRLNNRADAEDASQDVFLSLAKNAHRIRSGCLGGWLHRTAVNAANSKIRSDRARFRREQSRAVPDSLPDRLAEWRQIEEALDVCMAELPPENREIIVQRFFLHHSQDELAKLLSVDQATVSRRIKKSIELLRRQLTSRGISLSTATLLATLSENAGAQIVPASLSVALNKIGIAGVGGTQGQLLSGWLVGAPGLALLIALISTVIVTTVLLNADSPQNRGPSSVVLRRAGSLPTTLFAELSHLEYSKSISVSAMAINSLGRVALFNDMPAEFAGVYIFGRESLPLRLRIPEHRRRALALGDGEIVAVNYDRRIDVIDGTKVRLLTEVAAVDTPPSINERRLVAFIETEPRSRIRLASDDGIRTIHRSDDQFSSFEEVSVNMAGEIAFRAKTARRGEGLGEGIYVSRNGYAELVAEVGEKFAAFTPWFDFNDHAQVAFIAKLVDGSEAIFVGDANGLTQIAQSGSHFAQFRQVSMNNHGQIAFMARTPGEPPNAPVAGLYLWNGSEVIELLSRGQTVHGRTVRGILLWRDCLNDAGQIAALADFGAGALAAILRLETKDLDLVD